MRTSALLLLVTVLCIAVESTDDSGDIVARLMPAGAESRVQLRGMSKTTAAGALLSAQREATGKRGQDVAFLLASLGVEYTKNRDFLLAVLDRCRSAHQMDCDEDTVQLVMGLYANGHPELLQSLVAAGGHADGAGAELLGPFYGDVLKRHPHEFLRALGLLRPAEQDSVCELAAVGDGGGITLSDAVEIRSHLKTTANKVALRCLVHFKEPAEPR